MDQAVKNTSSKSEENSKEMYNKETIAYLSSLAKLDIPEDKYSFFAKELEHINQTILSPVLGIQCDVEPMYNVHNLELQMREDIPKTQVTREEILSTTPEKFRSQAEMMKSILVPKVIAQ